MWCATQELFNQVLYVYMSIFLCVMTSLVLGTVLRLPVALGGHVAYLIDD
jgi:hypothetical protein